METNYNGRSGLSDVQVKELQERYGKNELVPKKNENFLKKIFHVLSQPIFLLLLAASVIYFILGEPRDGLVMLVFVSGVIGIEAAQEWKTDRTLSALGNLSAPQVKVLRNGRETVILSSELVPGDIMFIHEGVKIPADGLLLQCNDLCVDESSLTGESAPVWKKSESEALRSGGHPPESRCYAGTLVTQGYAAVLVEKTGPLTEYGKIGASVANAADEKTPLQKQTDSLVRVCFVIAVALFLAVGLVTWLNLSALGPKQRFTQSLLSGITLAMALIPEEFPVILTVFLSMGAWRLAKKKTLVRRLSSVETLGAVSVLCVDKTGTITKNQMMVDETWAADGDEQNFTEVMGLACETEAYDPMEKAMLKYCEENSVFKSHLFAGELLGEYPFTSELKMMGHVWHHDGEIIIAVKGSPEQVLSLCDLSESERLSVDSRIFAMAKRGLRVIAVASAKLDCRSEIPDEVTGCNLRLCGLAGLVDPPRESVARDIALCRRAGIRTVMITGDNGVTAAAIAKKIGMPGGGDVITGDMLENISDHELREKVKNANIFSRVTPEHKMRIVKAFKENGHVVAMTGDGVNDAPALKYADIGIAMGKRGSEVSREAADLILLDDNFTTIVDTVKDGRRIYDNIRKAVGYVVAIHIPIAAASLLAPLLGIAPGSLLLLPLHVVLLELIVDPTCSVVLERQPAETDIMERKPRDPNEKMLTLRLLVKSVLQGAAVFAASFGLYYGSLLRSPGDVQTARSMGLAVIMLANLFLVLVNSSDHDGVITCIKSLICDRVMQAVIIVTLAGLAAILYTPLSGFLKLAPLSLNQMAMVFAAAAASVLWYEIVKLAWLLSAKRSKKRAGHHSAPSQSSGSPGQG
ncbi:MAG: cation-translocating P-type ATPase [Christensenellales bacterium]|jgi:Ca2+-transporting ATPase